jgi:LysM repeat protein
MQKRCLYFGMILSLCVVFNGGCVPKFFKKSGSPEQVPAKDEAGAAVRGEEKSYAVQAGQEYRVQPKDTLAKIARKYNISVSELAAFNDIKDINKLHMGKVLKIPSVGVPSENASVEKGENRITHKVEKGETLWGIAKFYGVKVDSIRAVNVLKENGHVDAGQVLYIPLK